MLFFFNILVDIFTYACALQIKKIDWFEIIEKQRKFRNPHICKNYENI